MLVELYEIIENYIDMRNGARKEKRRESEMSVTNKLHL